MHFYLCFILSRNEQSGIEFDLILQRAGVETANLPVHCLLWSLRQGGVSLGKAEDPGALSLHLISFQFFDKNH